MHVLQVPRELLRFLKNKGFFNIVKTLKNPFKFTEYLQTIDGKQAHEGA